MAHVDPRIVYSRRYDIGFFGLERLHPFDTRKYSRAYRLLGQRLGRRLGRATVWPRRPVGRDELLAVHTPEYLGRLRDPAYLARALEVPPVRRVPAWVTDWCVLRPMRWAAMGTVLAAREAARGGLAVNLSGGYHHAGPDRGEGFCVYNDIALAVHDLRESGTLSGEDKVVYIDLDAHQGNGVCHAFFGDRRVFIFDMYNRSIYPAADAKRRHAPLGDMGLSGEGIHDAGSRKHRRRPREQAACGCRRCGDLGVRPGRRSSDVGVNDWHFGPPPHLPTPLLTAPAASPPAGSPAPPPAPRGPGPAAP